MKKLVIINPCQYDGKDYNPGDILTQSETEVSFGGPWGWAQQDGNAEWQEVVPTLDELQSKKWDEIKAAREAAGNAPIEYLGKLFDFDEKARNNLRDAVIAAQSASALSIPFPDVSWTLYDNTTATLTRDQLLAFPLAAGIVRIGAVHAYARTLRDEIFKVGATVASVAAVKWAYTEGE